MRNQFIILPNPSRSSSRWPHASHTLFTPGHPSDSFSRVSSLSHSSSTDRTPSKFKDATHARRNRVLARVPRARAPQASAAASAAAAVAVASMGVETAVPSEARAAPSRAAVLVAFAAARALEAAVAFAACK